MFNLLNVLFAFIIVGVLLLIARFIKHKVPLFQTLYLPESIIAGAIALLLGSGVLGAIALGLGASPDSYLAGGLISRRNAGSMVTVAWSIYQYCLCCFVSGRAYSQSKRHLA